MAQKKYLTLTQAQKVLKQKGSFCYFKYIDNLGLKRTFYPETLNEAIEKHKQVESAYYIWIYSGKDNSTKFLQKDDGTPY